MGNWIRACAVIAMATFSCCYPPMATAADCPNEALRSGISAHLPGCRAYELVTPADSNGRLVETLNTFGFPPANQVVPSELASPTRDSLVFLTYQSALPDPRGGTGIADVYESERSSGEWQTTHRLTLSGLEAKRIIPGGVSPDHLYSFNRVEDPFSPLSIEGYPTQYLLQSGGDFELVGLGHLGTEPFAEGRYLGADGKHIVFSTGHGLLQSFLCIQNSACKVHQLEPDAAPTGTGAIYDREADGETHVVSLLPGEVPLKAGEEAFYKGTSKDASVTAFGVNGALYARIDNQETKQVASNDPTFAGVSEDGDYVFYVDPAGSGEAGVIHRFDTTTGIDIPVNSGDEGLIVNVSGNGSHVYFISKQALTGSEENEQGETARPPAKGAGTLADESTTASGVTAAEGTFLAGMEISGSGIPSGTTIVDVGLGTLTLSKPATQSGTAALSAGFPNLYVWSGGTPRYLATVLPSDLVKTSDAGSLYPALANWTSAVTNKPFEGNVEQGPGADSSRTNPDGTVLVFESKAQLTPYNNANHTEIYRYDDGDGGLLCVSCHPSTEPATKDAQLQDLINTPNSNVLHNVSDDGHHVFFETDEALVPEDVDGVNDIYEWQREGIDAGAKLISSGRSPRLPYPDVFGGEETPNFLFSITPDGDDVFFVSRDALTPGAPESGASAIYDARIGGGFPAPVEPLFCQEEDCRPQAGSTGTPSTSSTASESAQSSGNVKPHKHKCRHSKRKKSRCVKHKKKAKNHKGRRGATVSDAMGAGEDRAVASGESNQASQTSRVSSQGPPSATSLVADPRTNYGIDEVGAILAPTTAGAHPDFFTNITLTHTFKGNGELDESAIAATEEVRIDLPPGLLGNPNAVPRCTVGALVAFNCPTNSQVGVTRIFVTWLNKKLTEPVYNMVPPHPDEEIARFGFTAGLEKFPAFIDVKVRTASDYGVTATVYGTSSFVSLVGAETTLWGNPANPAHDKERLTPVEAPFCNTACKRPNGERPSTIPVSERKSFMTNPSGCQPMSLGASAKSYQFTDTHTASVSFGPITDCTGLPFAPSFEAEPTNHTAGAPTGLHTVLTLPQHLGEEERSTATMREARVTLPAGMQIAAGAANWIGTCSESQVGFHEEVDTACPDNSKLGTATISSPALPEPIEGAIYQRTPSPGHQFGLWLTADALGLHVKLPGELEPDKATGRLTAVFRDLPQVPVGQIELDVWGGSRAPLQNPDRCGIYTTDYSFSPHSNDPAAAGQSTMQITEGCDQPFSPTLHAGVTKPVAGAFSPFVFDLNRDDGSQALRGFVLRMPDGELAKIKGVPLCSDADATAGTCPAGSRIGSLQATTGPGPDPLQVPQPGKPEPQIYLAGPYQGAPFSIISEVPAQAGPFDLGTLAVRSGLEVEPESGRAVVKADPLPQFFEGVGIAYRHLHAMVDRPEFSLNPTDCREAKVTSDVTSTTGTVAHPAARFQIDGCKRLKFKPRLSLKLRGGTKRADYPALIAVLKARKSDANIAFTSVALPHSEFLAQEHIGTICTRKQFAVDKCPKKSVYGKAKAWTPLLGKPLAGPVYLRSSDHPLPDLVAKLGGQLEIFLVGRIDSVNGGIRTTFESVPDAPVSKFVLKMKGGKKGLLTNSTDICRGAHRATAVMRAQNGRVANLRPGLVASSCGSSKKGGKKK